MDDVTKLTTTIHEKDLTVVVKELHYKLSEYEKEIEQFEMIKSDWQMEKEALEDVLLKLREQVRHKDEALKMEDVHSEKKQTMARKNEQVLNKRRCSSGEAGACTIMDISSEREDVEQEGQIPLLDSKLHIENKPIVMQTECHAAQELYTTQEMQVASDKHPVDDIQSTYIKKAFVEKDIQMKRFSQELDSNESDLEKIVQENKRLKLQNILLYKQNVQILTRLKNRMQTLKSLETDSYGTDMTEKDVSFEYLEDDIYQLKMFMNEKTFCEMSRLDIEQIDFVWAEIMRQNSQAVSSNTIIPDMTSELKALNLDKLIQSENDELRISHSHKYNDHSSITMSEKDNVLTQKTFNEIVQGDFDGVKYGNAENIQAENPIRSESNDSPFIFLNETIKSDQLISQTDFMKSQMDSHSSFEFENNVLKNEIHQLEKQIKDLKLDKEQMMSVLNEKSRECSSLKSEVHHLMTVVSAEKMALNKLQQDKNVSKPENKQYPEMVWGDLSREAIEKLSKIIREKDIEMEALNQKNQTLVEVLQQSSDVESPISSFIDEKDQLLKRIQVLNYERENIIATLNTKHKESIEYHDELQKLSTLLSNEKQKNVKINSEFSTLKKQYDDKQHAFLKMQNEMVSYRQKFSELDKHHKDLLKKKHEISSSDPINSSAQLQMIMQGNLSPSSENVKSDAQASQMYIQELKSIEREKLLEQKSSIIQEQLALLQDKEFLISAKDRQISELNSYANRSDEALHLKTTEFNNLKKHSENVTFQLNGLQNEVTDLRLERNNLLEKHSIMIQEMNLLREENNRLTLVLEARKEKTPSTLLYEEHTGRENENMNSEEKLCIQMQMIKQEKDQSMLALQHQQTENHHFQQEIQRLKEKNKKQIKELDRLRGHLVTIEENYTQDAIASEERERELRNRLATLEEKAMSSTTAMQSVNFKKFQQVEEMANELQTLKDERDKAISERNTLLESATQYSESLQNLQMVLEQFQIERETQLNMEVERYQYEINVCKAENLQLHEQNHDLQVQVNDASDALAAGRRLSEQLDHKEEMIAALREEVQLREMELKKAENDIRLLSVSREARVDKELIRNMILGYFHTPVAKQKEALQLIGRVLDFSEADVKEINIKSEHRWLGGLFQKSPASSAKLNHKSSEQSFSELFVNFLERESSPQPNFKFGLPSEGCHSKVTSQTSFDKYDESKQNPTNSNNENIANPFSVSVSYPDYLYQKKESTTSIARPLKKPVSKSLHIFRGMVGIPVYEAECVVSESLSKSPLMHAKSESDSTNSVTSLRDVLHE